MSTQRARVPTFRDFYGRVEEELPALLPKDLRDYQTSRMGRVFKVFYDDRRRHYELWFRAGGLEVGFHLEGSPEENDDLARVLDSRLPAIRRRLGGDVRLEPFGREWTRLFELWPGASRQPDLASEAAARLTEFVRLIEPIRRG